MKFEHFSKRLGNPFRKVPLPHRRITKRPGVALLVLPFLLLALFIGLLGGLGSPQVVVIAGGAVLSLLVLLLLPLYGMFLCLLVLTFVVQGSIGYFLKFQSASWMSFGLAILFFCRVLIDLVMRNQRPGDKDEHRGGAMVVSAAGLFLLIFAISMVFNRTPITQIVSSVKSYLPMFSVLFAMAWFRWTEQQVESVWRLMIGITYVQLPVVLYQHFVLMTPRSFDSVVGTFGGTQGAGGNSAVMVLFTVIVMLYGLARWDNGLMSRRSLTALIVTGLALILLGEVKAAVIWLPFGALWVLRRRAMRSVGTLITLVTLLGAFVTTTWFVYEHLYWGKNLRSAHTVEDKIEKSGGYFFDPNNVNYVTGEISRGASLALWFRDPLGGVPERLVGYGPSASKPSGLMGAGVLALRYAPLNLNATALAILLWDVGLLGAVAYTLMLFAAAVVALRITRDSRASPGQRSMANMLVAALTLFITMLIYSRGIIDEPTAQLILMLCLGSTVHLAKALKSVPKSLSAAKLGTQKVSAVHTTHYAK